MECILENNFGKLYVTSEGWHINGQKNKFIASVKRQLKSKYLDKQLYAEIALNYIKDYPEI